jgi:uncharacterized protein YcaQ
VSGELSLQQARNLHLAAQGLLVPPAKAATRGALRQCIANMQLLQIDTIHVVARSPYLVLFSRLGAYPQAWLDEALAKGHLFETWAHEACFAPIADLRSHRTYNQEARSHWGLVNAQKIQKQQRQHLDKLIAHIRERGPVKSSDFERPAGQASAWWGWKDEKRWLEALFASGELMVARRENFHRVYDLSERVAPQLCAEAPQISCDEVAQQFIEKAITTLGVTQACWVHDYFRMKPRLKDADLDELVEQRRLLRVRVEGWDVPGYVRADNARLLKRARANKLEAAHTSLLSPFDPVVWDRARASSLFDFDYRLECYTPEHKRVHGYFVLPILCRGELIGRLDAKAHRAEGVFEVKAVHAQPGVRWSEQQIADVASAIADCAAWHGTPKVRVASTQPAALAAKLRAALRVLHTGSDPH